jgi:hypothetical protein
VTEAVRRRQVPTGDEGDFDRVQGGCGSPTAIALTLAHLALSRLRSPTHRAVDLMEAGTSAAEGLSRSGARPRRRARRTSKDGRLATPYGRVLDSPSAAEKGRFHEVDGALCRDFAVTGAARRLRLRG